MSEPYKARLAEAARAFAHWADTRRIDLPAALGSAEGATQALIEFIQEAHDAGLSLSVATHAVLAVQTAHRGLRGKLRGAWDSVLSWKLQSPVYSRTPMPLMLMEAIRLFAVLSACALDRKRAVAWMSFAAVLGAGFWGLMRPAEIWNAKRRSVRTPSEQSLLLENIAVISIENAKNRAFMGRLQVRSVRDPSSVEWLSWLTVDMDLEDKIWAFTPLLFRRLLAESLQFLGLAGLGITSASLRAGGATTLLEKGVPLSTIRFCGSWSSERVMATYLQESEAAATMLRVPKHGVARVKWLLSEFGAYRRPPRLPLSRLVQQRWTLPKRSSSSPPLR